MASDIRRRGRRAAVAAALLAASAGIGLAVHLGPPGPWTALAAILDAAPGAAGTTAGSDRPAQPVQVTPIVFRGTGTAETYTGLVRPGRETTPAFRIAGKLVSRPVDIGARVLPGMVIARLDDTDARLELAAASAEVRAAETDLDRAEAALDRSRALVRAGHSAEAALDAAESGRAEAAARLDRARQARDLAANRLDYTELRAEAAGVVTAVRAEPGQVLAAGQAVLSVAEGTARDVVFALPEHRLPAIDTARAHAAIWGDPGDPLPLRLRDIAPDADPASRTYRVRMTLVDPAGRAALGRTVTVTLQLPAGAPAAALPLAAIVSDGQGAAVWRLPPGASRVERVPVTVAALDGRVALVRGPLADGDLVLGLGAYKIDPHRPVRVVGTAPPAQP
jgi:RND family efflux transporter MFP subunit